MTRTTRAFRLAPLSMMLFVVACSGSREPPPPRGSIDNVVDVPAATPVHTAGIGIRPVIHAHGFAIGQLFPGGPADRAGLRVGDVVVEVDGDSTARWTLERAAKRLRGAVGSTVALAAERGGERLEVRLARQTIAAP
jgi:C-terminal processing protease CtpA/Prc